MNIHVVCGSTYAYNLYSARLFFGSEKQTVAKFLTIWVQNNTFCKISNAKTVELSYRKFKLKFVIVENFMRKNIVLKIL